MSMMNTTQSQPKRNRQDGKYTYAKLDRVCECARRLGAHSAEAPHPFDGDDGGPECEKFKPAKK